MDIKQFLFNNDEKYFLYEEGSRKYTIYKEVNSDGFYNLYLKRYSSGLIHDDYEVAGCYDSKNKVLYRPHYIIYDIVKKDDEIKISSFEKLKEQIFQDLEKYLEDYTFKNEKIVGKNGEILFEELSDYHIESIKKTVMICFTKNNYKEMGLKRSFSKDEFLYNEEFKNGNVYRDYINDKDVVIKRLASEVINKSKDKMALNLFIYNFQKEYLDQINRNRNGKYDYIFINKNIYDSIKDLGAKKINITIEYGGDSFTFKHDYNSLKRELENGYIRDSGYGASYQAVADFINSKTKGDKYRSPYFCFSNISKITYGKKAIYRNDNIIDRDSFTKDKESR